MGWGDIGYNDDTFVTPFIDTVASHGVKFNNFYVQVLPLLQPHLTALVNIFPQQRHSCIDAIIVNNHVCFIPGLYFVSVFITMRDGVMVS